jgi:hypothetical protein
MLSNLFLKKKKYRSVYEIMWEITVYPGKSQTTTWRMRFACWIRKATNTHSDYVILIPFLLPQQSHERSLNVTLYLN